MKDNPARSISVSSTVVIGVVATRGGPSPAGPAPTRPAACLTLNGWVAAGTKISRSSRSASRASARQEQVANVGRIERSAEDPNSHLVYVAGVEGAGPQASLTSRSFG